MTDEPIGKVLWGLFDLSGFYQMQTFEYLF